MTRLVGTALAVASCISVATVVSAAGEPDTGFGTAGVVTGGLLDTYDALTVDSTGRIVVAGTTGGQAALARFSAAGQPDVSFSGDGRVELGVTGSNFRLFDVGVLGSGAVVVTGINRSVPADPFSNQWFTARVSGAGVLDPTFGSGGVATEDMFYTFVNPDASIATDGSATLVAQGIGIPINSFILHVDAGGTVTQPPVPDYAPNVVPPGCAAQGYAARSVVHVTTTSVIHVGGALWGCGSDITGTVVLSRQTVATGAVEWSATLPAGSAIAEVGNTELARVGDDVVVNTVNGSTIQIHRYSTAGAAVSGWGTSGVAALASGFGAVGSIAELAGGRVGVVSTSGAAPSTSVLVDRLLPNGAVDTGFGRVSTPLGADLQRTDIAGAPDGGVLVTTQTSSAGALRRYTGSTPTLESLTPGRLMDTRPGLTTVDGQFAGIGLRDSNSTTELQVGGRGGVPADAEAVVLNVTVTGAQGNGFITVFPCGQAVPTASNLNFVTGDTVANAVVVKMGTGGKVCLFAAEATTHLIADVNGYFPAGSGFESLAPGRLMDTREGLTTVDGQFAGIGLRTANSITELQVGGRGGVPANADAVALNVTVTGPQGSGFITVFPCGQAVPTASNLNFTAGDTVPNAVIVKMGTGGKVCLFAAEATTHLITDVNGYFPAGSGFSSLAPGRLMDTREGLTTVDGQFAGIGLRTANSITELQVGGRGGVPANASAVVLNVTVTGAQGNGFITVFPCGQAVPTASNLNFTAGATVANAVVVKVGTGGKVCLLAAEGATHLIADVNGYFP